MVISYSNHAGGYHAKPDCGQYLCLDLDFHLCQFELSSSCYRADGCVVFACFLGPTFWRSNIRVVCKVVDVQCYPAVEDQLAVEAHAYIALHNLQGCVIPRFHDFYCVWEILRLLALESGASWHLAMQSLKTKISTRHFTGK